MFYTAVIKTEEGYKMAWCFGVDWWVARNNLGVPKSDLVALIPGKHSAGISFNNDGVALRNLDPVHQNVSVDPIDR